MINLKKSKRSQAEIIITVLLILIGIAAVGFVGVFLTNMIRNNLQQTDCFKTTGQLNINLGYTFFNATSKVVYVSIERGSADFNLSGLIITVGTAQSARAATLSSGLATDITKDNGFVMLTSAGAMDTGKAISMPGFGETTSYAINSTKFSSVNLVSITPMLKDKACENKADEKEIRTVV